MMNKKQLWVNKKQRCEQALKKRWSVINPAWQSLKDKKITREDYDEIVHHIDIWYYNKLDYINRDTKIREVE